MFKRINTLTFLLLITQSLIAQNNGFIVKDYYPAKTFPYCPNILDIESMSFTLDLDNDGMDDIRFERALNRRAQYFVLRIHGTQNTTINKCTEYTNTSSIADFVQSKEVFWDVYKPYEEFFYVAVKKQVGDNIYYGWVLSYVYACTWYACSRKYDTAYFIAYSSAMCTIPNQHIFMGQTSLEEQVPASNSSEDVWSYSLGKYTLLQCSDTNSFNAVSVYDLQGRPVYEVHDINSSFVTLDLYTIPVGIYIIRYRLAGGETGTIKTLHSR